MSKADFITELSYSDRQSKAEFVYKKYKPILRGSILDVGADQGYLSNFLSPEISYTGIGFSNRKDIIEVNLEKENIPFANNSYNCVLCLDVLEHLDNIHQVFDELCRVSSDWIIISLPNPWSDFLNVLKKTPYAEGMNTKFYGLPVEPPEDRHKWFFSSGEAKEFIKYRAEKNGFELYDLYVFRENHTGTPDFSGILGPFRKWKFKYARKMFFRENLHYPDLYEGTQWYVLRKK